MNSSTDGGNPFALVAAKNPHKLPSAAASANVRAELKRTKEKGRKAEERSRKATTELEHHIAKKAAATKKLQEAEGNTKNVDLTPKFMKGAVKEVGIVDEAATGSCNTKKLRDDDKTTLSPNSKNKLPWQGTKLNKSQIAEKSNRAVYNGSDAKWSGVIYGSKGFKVNPKTNKRVCIATSEMTAAKYEAQENKPRYGEENEWNVCLPQVTFSSDGEEIGMELWDKHGKRVTKEMYQQDHKLAKTVWVPNPDRMGELFDLLNKTGDGKKKWKLGNSQNSKKKNNILYKKLTDKKGMFFKGERVCDGEVLVGCHPSDVRLKTAGYKITIHEESNVQFFAPYDDLALNAKSAPKRKAASKN